jgi:hypothetical protein
MAGLQVAIAAYVTLEDATSDWVAFEGEAGPGAVVDGAVIERTLAEVTCFHRGSVGGWGQGVIASAVCGVLWPPALLVGALAGGVGGEVITAVRCGLSSESVRDLSEVLEAGPFVAVVITDDRFVPPPGFGHHARSRTRVPLRSTTAEMVGALRGDEERDR